VWGGGAQCHGGGRVAVEFRDGVAQWGVAAEGVDVEPCGWGRTVGERDHRQGRVERSGRCIYNHNGEVDLLFDVVGYLPK
jgi:hypothetical protein